jgi:hypothetical protein
VKRLLCFIQENAVCLAYCKQSLQIHGSFPNGEDWLFGPLQRSLQARQALFVAKPNIGNARLTVYLTLASMA